MGYVYVAAHLEGTRTVQTLECLVDTGAFRNYLPSTLQDGRTPDDIGFHVFEGLHEAILADERKASGYRVRFPRLKVGTQVVEEIEFVVLPSLAMHAKDAILGAGLMQRLDWRVRPKAHRVE